MKNREPFKTSLQEAFAFSCFFLREERASAKVLRDYVTRISETLCAARGARTERAADARPELQTRNFHMGAVHAVEERGPPVSLAADSEPSEWCRAALDVI